MVHADDMVAAIQDEFRIVGYHEEGLAAVCKRL